MNHLLLSDPHFHAWTTFASVDERGVNTRLVTIASEMIRAMAFHINRGGEKRMIIAGDVFHTRGAVQTSTLNFVMDVFRAIKKDGWGVTILSGNHDLESNDSMRLSSAVTALESCAKVITQPDLLWDEKVLMVPWQKNVADLKTFFETRMVDFDRSDCDLIIHAPIDDVIVGLPDHGLDSKYLSELGFKRVFAGHYHNHKDFGNNVWSIGATTHQTFSDIGSKAGFISIVDDEVKWFASHAPKFVEINADNFDDHKLIVDGNYVRCVISVKKDSDVELIKKTMMDAGALGVTVMQIKGAVVTERKSSLAAVESGSLSIKSSISNYVGNKGWSKAIEDICFEIMDQVEEVE
jgi:DNA repair exonuclease SbcCD nuclease subunit